MCLKNNLIYLAPRNLIRTQLNSAECIHHVTCCTLIHFICYFYFKDAVELFGPAVNLSKIIHFMHALIGPQEHYGKQNMYIIMHATYNSFEFNLFGNVCAGETSTSGVSLPVLPKKISFWPLPCFPSDTCINGSIQEKK